MSGPDQEQSLLQQKLPRREFVKKLAAVAVVSVTGGGLLEWLFADNGRVEADATDVLAEEVVSPTPTAYLNCEKHPDEESVGLYLHDHCQGLFHRRFWKPGPRNLEDFNDLPGSVYVGKDASVRVYGDFNQTGPSTCVKESVDNLAGMPYEEGAGQARTMGNDISSITVYNNSDCRAY